MNVVFLLFPTIIYEFVDSCVKQALKLVANLEIPGTGRKFVNFVY